MSIAKWFSRKSLYVRKDEWISLREDECVTPDGAVVAPYYVIEYPDWVHVVALDERNRLLMVRQYRHGSGEITLELPAGRIEHGDADAVVAGTRELMEETGCSPGTVRLVGVHWANAANQTNRIHTVLAERVHEVRRPMDSSVEQLETVWLELDEATAKARSGEMAPLFQVGSLWLALMALGQARGPNKRA